MGANAFYYDGLVPWQKDLFGCSDLQIQESEPSCLEKQGLRIWKVIGLVPFWLLYLTPKAKEKRECNLSKKKHKKNKKIKLKCICRRREKCKLRGGGGSGSPFLFDREPEKHKAEQSLSIQRLSFRISFKKLLPYSPAFPR